jgi:hypothetical protein
VSAPAWDELDAVARLRDSPAHGDAMRRFFSHAADGLAAGGQTGVWSPQRLNGLWARCTSCGRMVRVGPDGGCACGAELSPPRYW